MVGNTASTGGAANPSLAAIYMTTNGGTCWSPVNVQPYNSASLQATLTGCATTCAPTAASIALYAKPMPGALMGVASTGSGKYVYAVGAAPAVSDGTLTASDTSLNNLNYVEASYGSILFSANAGASWCAHAAGQPRWPSRSCATEPRAPRTPRALSGRCRRRPRTRAGRTA